MVEEAALPINTPIRTFEDHERYISGVAVFPDKRRMVTGSDDKTLRLWDLKNGNPLKKMEGHCIGVRALAVTGDGELIASGDVRGELIAWDGDTGESVTQARVKAHSDWIYSLDFSPDGTVLATGSFDCTTKLWNTTTWQLQGSPINCDAYVWCVRYSPSGKHLAIATSSNIQILNSSTRECIANFEGHARARFSAACNESLAWARGGRCLLSGGNSQDPTIREWDPSTWKQVGYPWLGHTRSINAIAVNSSGTLVASASDDYHVRLWRLLDRRTIAIFKHSDWVHRLTFTADDKEILSGGNSHKISKWAIPEDALPYAEIPAARNTIARSAAAALINAQKVIDLDPSSYHGYRLKHAALHDAQRYDEAIATFQIMLSMLENAPNLPIRKIYQHYITPSEAERRIRTDIRAHLNKITPLRLLDTTTGLLCNRDAQINIFTTSALYKKLLSSTMKHPDFRIERIEEVAATYFSCVMLSHRWEENEPLLHDIQGNVVYELNPVGSIVKLQSFCEIARDAGYRWAWSDTCCIDKTNQVELQRSLNSMFVWYRHSALTIVYLSDVSSNSGALAQSEWIKRGWTIGEFLGPKVVLFYQKDWTRYLGDHSPNHKKSDVIMRELGNKTGIDREALVAFCPGMTGAREKLRWASMRVTTEPEDVAYSLFGIFKTDIPVSYGEGKQKALGRLLQKIVVEPGNITVLDWVGKPSEFNSCLPANITSYFDRPPSFSSASLGSKDGMQSMAVSFPPLPIPVSFLELPMAVLQHVDTVSSAVASAVRSAVASTLGLYQTLENLSAPDFIDHRLHLPCIVFPITKLEQTSIQGSAYSYEVKAKGLRNLRITTEDSQIAAQSNLARQKFLLVRPWNHDLLDADNTRSRALFVRLGQPFGAFLLQQQRVGEYKRIASDRNITAQVKYTTSLRSDMVKTLKIS